MVKLKILDERARARINRQDREMSSRGVSERSAASLAQVLKTRIRGEVRFDEGSRALYATDGSNYRHVPIGVVIPREIDDVIETVAAAREHQAPILSRGGGTSLAGQCCNVAVVIDFSKYLHRVVGIDREACLGFVQPGCVLDDLRDAAKQVGLTFGPDPATHKHCTIGGMLGNNSCGSHSLLSAKHGIGLRTSDNTHELEVLTYDGARFRVGPTSPEELERIIKEGGRQGEIYAQLQAFRDRHAEVIRRKMPQLPRRVSGYNLDELLPEKGFNVARALVGSESTLVTILDATLQLVPHPQARSLLVVGYSDIFSAGDHVTDILPLKPTALEGLDHLLIEYIKKKGGEESNLKMLPDGQAFLMVEFGGESQEDADDQARRCQQMLENQKNPPPTRLFDDPDEEEKLWKVREGGLGATAFVPGLSDMWPGWEDSAVAPEHVGNYLRKLRSLFGKYGYNPSIYGHFGQGCIHCRIDFDLYTSDGIRNWACFLGEAADLVASFGGSLSGEHGDGQARAELLSKMFGDELVSAFKEFKQIWDPGDKMNPGKIVDPHRSTQDLRLGADYSPPNPTTHFHYPDDRGTFGRAALRCVGVGKCRDHSGQVMCPSYLATREEKHSTRGRARLLWEMLNGNVLTGGWKNKAVKEALDLCLACKGCKHDCPVNVDMATYKAEFLSHYYSGCLRPRSAYAMGWIHRWAQFASHGPQIANFFSQTPVFRTAVKWMGGIAQQRSLPRFAREPFTAWFRRRRSTARTDAPRVLLWPDTFNNYFHPDVAKAAVEVLEAAGFRIQLPGQRLCCGRPLYDFGMLDLAKKLLHQILDALQPQIEAGVPIVGLEPSCVAVFRDELVNLFPNDEYAKRLKNKTFLLSEFLVQQAPTFQLPQLHRNAILHGHCHQKSLMGLDDEKRILKAIGLTVETPEDGCCGMAGSFGFERGEHYQVSTTCGERALLPAVRKAKDDTLIIANGFSCHEQIQQGTGRRPLHLAQVLQKALHAEAGLADLDDRKMEEVAHQ